MMEKTGFLLCKNLKAIRRPAMPESELSDMRYAHGGVQKREPQNRRVPGRMIPALGCAKRIGNFSLLRRDHAMRLVLGSPVWGTVKNIFV
jgi:hypothetical protein